MLGWIFGGLVRKFESASRAVIKSARREIDGLFDEKIFPLADKFDYIAQERINQTFNETEQLEERVKNEIESLLNQTDGKVKENLEILNKLREDSLRDVRETVGETDAYIENRINQISLVLMEALAETQGITEQIFVEVNDLENKLFRDANQLLDKINEMLEGKIEQFRNELKKHLAHGLPNPLDKCRQRLNLRMKPGAMLSDVELYELTECYELGKLNANTSIDEVLKIYGQLQLNASRMAALVKDAPILKRRAIEDWMKYGILCEFWHRTMQVYDVSSLLLESQKSQGMLMGDEN